MFNLEYRWVDIDCPACGYNFDVMVLTFKLEEPCFCWVFQSVKVLSKPEPFHLISLGIVKKEFHMPGLFSLFLCPSATLWKVCNPFPFD